MHQVLMHILYITAFFVAGYFVGANNPWKSVKDKIINDANAGINKLK